MIKSIFGSEPRSEKETTAFEAAKAAKSEDTAVKAAASAVRPFVPVFKVFANAEKTLAKNTATLAAVIVADVASAVAEATASTGASKLRRVRKVWTQALLAEGVPLRTASRWLSSIVVEGGEPLFATRQRGQTESEFNLDKAMRGLMKSAGSVKLSEIVKAAVKAGAVNDL